MTLGLVRVDSRLIHGQISTSWVPQLGLEVALVADAEVLADPLEATLVRGAAPLGLEVELCPPPEVSTRLDAHGDRQVLVLFRTVAAVHEAWESGFRFEQLNLGNCHSGAGRARLTDSVYLADDDLARLYVLHDAGVELVCQALPSDPRRRLFTETPVKGEEAVQ